jgi:nicotinamide-nucleotide adenylyltransferase
LVGRFQPFHNGHMSLILEILKRFDIVKIGIGSVQYFHTQENPFTYEERKDMITLALNETKISSERYQIYPVPDFHDMLRWTMEVLKILGDFDMYFSNSDWTRQLILQSGKQVSAYFKFNFEKFNGTCIRNAILHNESIDDLVPSSVKQYLQKINIYQRFKEYSQ